MHPYLYAPVLRYLQRKSEMVKFQIRCLFENLWDLQAKRLTKCHHLFLLKDDFFYIVTIKLLLFLS